MLVIAWVAVMVIGFAAMVAASHQAVAHGSALASGLRVPPFLIGVTLLAVGTDLPEIANSIAASLAQRGDLNVGDSLGSAATQATLVLGLLPLIAGPILIGRRRVLTIGVATCVALVVVVALVSDGFLSRADAMLLIGLWIAASLAVWRVAPGSEAVLPVPARRKAYHAGAALAALAGVAVGATLAVAAIINLAELLDVPDLIISFFVASIGTSLPELAVDLTALRRGERDLAIGDVLGSSLVDSTLSLGAGPLIAPTAITADLSVRGAVATLVAIALVTVLLVSAGRHSRLTGLVLIAVYAGLYLLLLR